MRTPPPRASSFIAYCADDPMRESITYKGGVVIPHREFCLDSSGDENNVIKAEVSWFIWDDKPIPDMEVGKTYLITIQEIDGIKPEDV